MSPRKELHMATKFKKKGYSCKGSRKYHSTANHQAEFDAIQKEAKMKEEMFRQAMANGDPVTRPENFVNGIQVGHRGSLFTVRKGVYKDPAGNCAVDIQLYPSLPDAMGVCVNKPFLSRKTLHVPAEKAEAFLYENVTIFEEMVKNGVRMQSDDHSRAILKSPRDGLVCKQYIIGYEFDHAGTIYTQECLYCDAGWKQFTLEITLLAKEPDTLGLQGDEPYIDRVAVPLPRDKTVIWLLSTDI